MIEPTHDVLTKKQESAHMIRKPLIVGVVFTVLSVIALLSYKVICYYNTDICNMLGPEFFYICAGLTGMAFIFTIIFTAVLMCDSCCTKPDPESLLTFRNEYHSIF